MRVVLTRRSLWELLSLLLLLPLALYGLYRGVCCFERAAYPMEHRELIEQASEEFGVPVSLICAVIHTESGFRTQALSHAQAYGLMQITEDTFLWAQQRSAEEEALSVESLYDPAVNIRYGVYILSLLRERFADTETLLAAYNAGAGRVEQWLQDPAYAADGVLRTIPYEETARYVEKVQQAQQCYCRIYGLA